MRAARALGTALTLAVLSVALVAQPATALGAGDSPTPVVQYPGDPVEEAKLVASEDQRLMRVRGLIEAAGRAGLSQNQPYRLATGAIPTLVLASRDTPYTLDSLVDVAPRSVSRDGDGAYLLSENLVIATGASLDISADNGLTLRMMSGPDGFVSIIAAGGTLIVDGSSTLPITVTSWNRAAGAPDTDTSDGRSYVRAFGGQVALSATVFSDLGFWSGVTGGFSLTGTDPLSLGSGSGEPAASTPLEGQLLPADGGVSTLAPDAQLADYGYSTAVIAGVTFLRNAFGLFATKSDRIEIVSSQFEGSLVDGLMFHRDVTNSRIRSSSATGNARDGVRITRATSSISIERVTASGNGRNGISLEGGPLATGPSASGMPVSVYGNNRVSSSVSTGNGRYGIEVVGGDTLTLSGNRIARNLMGIVVNAGATNVSITDNRVEQSEKQGILLHDAGLDAVVTDNRIDHAAIGILLRDAGARVANNEITAATIHGVSLAGATGSSTVTNNTVSGAGPSAIDVDRTSGAAVRHNDVTGWESTKPLLVVLGSIFQPLTVVWILIALAVALSAVARIRRQHALRHPYADHAPLSTLSRGIVSRQDLRNR